MNDWWVVVRVLGAVGLGLVNVSMMAQLACLLVVAGDGLETLVKADLNLLYQVVPGTIGLKNRIIRKTE